MNDETAYRPATLLVHAGTERYPLGDGIEAISVPAPPQPCSRKPTLPNCWPDSSRSSAACTCSSG